ncbi:MAG: transporter [Planctomycetia bacterium]|nr:transporter [Planctomycetia bacterium]
MRGHTHRRILIVACLLAFAGSGQAQDSRLEFPVAQAPVERITSTTAVRETREFGGGQRGGSPVETLESLTGEREERDEIETDRDSFTPATTTAGRRRLIVELAYSFIDNRGVKETHSFPELILRYGVTERIELRFGWNAEMGGAGSSVSGASFDEGDELFGRSGRIEREYALSYGVKFRVTDQDRWIPGSAIIVQGKTPTGGNSTLTPATGLVATVVAGWELPNRWRFDTAIRYGFGSEEGDRFNLWAPSAVLRVPIRERWAAHGEYFGIVTSGKEQNVTRHYFSPGLHWLATPDLEIGFRLGWGLNDQSARFFANTGVGWRF